MWLEPDSKWESRSQRGNGGTLRLSLSLYLPPSPPALCIFLRRAREGRKRRHLPSLSLSLSPLSVCLSLSYHSSTSMARTGERQSGRGRTRQKQKALMPQVIFLNYHRDPPLFIYMPLLADAALTGGIGAAPSHPLGSSKPPTFESPSRVTLRVSPIRGRVTDRAEFPGQLIRIESAGQRLLILSGEKFPPTITKRPKKSPQRRNLSAH